MADLAAAAARRLALLRAARAEAAAAVSRSHPLGGETVRLPTRRASQPVRNASAAAKGTVSPVSVGSQGRETRETAGLDADDEAEREAIQAEPELPPEGSVERERQDRAQQRMVRGLVSAGMQRPPAWSDAGAWPTPGCRCARCGSGRWWCEVGEAPRGWRCRTCHPPDHLPADAVREVRT
jgi:hypothetical protein